IFRSAGGPAFTEAETSAAAVLMPALTAGAMGAWAASAQAPAKISARGPGTMLLGPERARRNQTPEAPGGRPPGRAPVRRAAAAGGAGHARHPPDDIGPDAHGGRAVGSRVRGPADAHSRPSDDCGYPPVGRSGRDHTVALARLRANPSPASGRPAPAGGPFQ